MGEPLTDALLIKVEQCQMYLPLLKEAGIPHPPDIEIINVDSSQPMTPEQVEWMLRIYHKVDGWLKELRRLCQEELGFTEKQMDLMYKAFYQ